MKKKHICILLAVFASTPRTNGNCAPADDLFDSRIELLVSSTNYWGVDAGRLKSVCEDVGGFLAHRYIIPREKHAPLPQVFRIFADSPLPSDIDLASSNMWTCTRRYVLQSLFSSPVVREDTNCWLAVARARRNMAPLRARKWHEYLDCTPGSTVKHPDGTTTFEVPPDKRYLINGDSTVEIRPDGRARVVVPNGPGVVCGARLGRRPLMPAEGLEIDIEASDGFFLYALGRIPQTDRFKSMTHEERNSMVSNLVATAQLTEAELARTGLSHYVAPDDAGDPPSPPASPDLL